MNNIISTKQRLIDRLGSYWKMEAGCIVMIPAVMIYLGEGRLTPATYAAMVPMMILLAIGASYWRTKFLQLTMARHDPAPLLNIIRRIRPVTLALTLAAIAYSLMIWIKPELSAGLTDRTIASVASALALAEYINYYHRQLQHFDNLADFKRLLNGKGFRRSQMAVDLEAAAVGVAESR